MGESNLNNKNHNARIVVLVAILGILFGLILAGLFFILNDSDKMVSLNYEVSDSSQGYVFQSKEILVSDINPATSCSSGGNGGDVNPKEEGHLDINIPGNT